MAAPASSDADPNRQRRTSSNIKRPLPICCPPGLEFIRDRIAHLAPGRPFDAADEQRLEAETLHGRHVVAEHILADPAFAVRRDPDDRLVLAAVLRIEGLVCKGSRQDFAARRDDGILIKLIVGVLEFAGHAFRDRVVALADGYRELMAFAVVALPAPAARNESLEFLVVAAAAGEGG